ncbi:MAG: hypothetical protein ACLPT4_17275, partial [Verrucomicrobiia bacterium]
MPDRPGAEALTIETFTHGAGNGRPRRYDSAIPTSRDSSQCLSTASRTPIATALGLALRVTVWR